MEQNEQLHFFISFLTLLFSSFSFHPLLSPLLLPQLQGRLDWSSPHTPHMNEGAGSVQLCGVIIMDGFPMNPQFNLLVSTQDGSASYALSALRTGLMRITAYPGQSGSKPIESRPHWCTNAHTHGAAPRAKHVTIQKWRR